MPLFPDCWGSVGGHHWISLRSLFLFYRSFPIFLFFPLVPFSLCSESFFVVNTELKTVYPVCQGTGTFHASTLLVLASHKYSCTVLLENMFFFSNLFSTPLLSSTGDCIFSKAGIELVILPLLSSQISGVICVAHQPGQKHTFNLLTFTMWNGY